MPATATPTKKKGPTAKSIRPLGDRILVEPVEVEEKTKSGIYIPEKSKEKPKEAIIIALGEGKLLDNGERVPFQVKKGDRVLLRESTFSEYGGRLIKIGDEEVGIITEDDILGVIE